MAENRRGERAHHARRHGARPGPEQQEPLRDVIGRPCAGLHRRAAARRISSIASRETARERRPWQAADEAGEIQRGLQARNAVDGRHEPCERRRAALQIGALLRDGPRGSARSSATHASGSDAGERDHDCRRAAPRHIAIEDRRRPARTAEVLPRAATTSAAICARRCRFP